MAGDELADVLSEFARTMLTDFPIQGILDHLVKQIVGMLPVTAAGVTLISAGSAPRYIAASDGAALRYERLQTELGEGPCLAACHTGEVVAVPDLHGESRFPHFVPRALEAGLAAVFTFPLRHRDARVGALDLYRDAAGGLSGDAMTTAQTLADVAAAYVLNAEARAELQDASDRATHAARHDPLTGLPNRALMLERLAHAFARSGRSRSACALLFVDLNDFKAVNDTYGHHIGDEVLITVGQRLTAVLRPSDTLARMSGDEFVILCEDLEQPSRADMILDRVDAAIARPFLLSGVEVSITASIGIAFPDRSVDAPEQLIHEADVAMYQIKHAQSGSRRVFDLRGPSLVDDRDGLEQGLRGAAERDELDLVYQPIVSAQAQALTGVEALVRWTHPRSGAIPPAVLIPLAERSGQITAIGQWVLQRAWADRYRWQRHSGVDMAVSVNVSAHQLMASGFVDTVASVLESAPGEPRLLTLEMTESVFLADGDRAVFVLKHLKEVGVRLALDHFGSGYSSLNYLMRFPVDGVKIDQEFIAKLGIDPASRTIVSAIIQLAHNLGMTVISEGVETAEQHRQLIQLGCDLCQGFYFFAPTATAELDSLVQGAPRQRRLPPGSSTDPGRRPRDAVTP